MSAIRPRDVATACVRAARAHATVGKSFPVYDPRRWANRAAYQADLDRHTKAVAATTDFQAAVVTALDCGQLLAYAQVAKVLTEAGPDAVEQLSALLAAQVTEVRQRLA